MRKIARANAGLEGYRVPARATAEQFQLFQRYQQVRHGDGDMASMSFYDYRAMVEDTPIETFIIEFRDEQDRLLSACLTDKLGDGLSAVYSFFAPGLEKRSLGTHAVLWLIERARALGLPYVYLGYWVSDSRKMAYKARFRPSEILVNGMWRVLTDVEIAGADAARGRADVGNGGVKPCRGVAQTLRHGPPCQGHLSRQGIGGPDKPGHDGGVAMTHAADA